MTDTLQVMDLIVNGPVKAAIRRNRIQIIFNYFQAWKIKRLQHAASNDSSLPPLFAPPKPTQSEGLLTLFEVLSTSLATPKFQESMKKCFVTVGLAPVNDGSYLLYNATRKGTLVQLMPQVQYSDDAVSVGAMAAEIALTSRPEDSSDEEDSSADEEEGEEEEGEGGDSRVQEILLKYSNQGEEGEEGEEEDF